jgi:beta-lactamase superfamily II metal-dependent hydrolase
VRKGFSLPIGQVTLQFLWPSEELHKGNDEGRDNSLIVRLLSPGLRLLLLGEGAQSSYALAGLVGTAAISNLRADVVQMMGTPDKTPLPEVETLLQQIRPSLLVISPAARRSSNPDEHPLNTPGQTRWQIAQLGQEVLEMSANPQGWGIS